MTKEDKELLLKDLCARVPYGVMVNVDGYGTEKLIGVESETITTKARPSSYSDKGKYPVDIVKPYLRPMESMTEDEKNEFIKFTAVSMHFFWCEATDTGHWYNNWAEEDWLDAHHFDYRGLIGQGLAIEVTEKNNPYKL